MLTLASVAASPESATYDVGDAVLRPLQSNDVDLLADFLESLEPLTRKRWELDSSDRAQAQQRCVDIAQYDKLYLVVDKQEEIAGVFDFSFDIPETDTTRYKSYGLTLDQRSDCRFGPCFREKYHGTGLASGAAVALFDVARRFGKERIFLWGGVLAENKPAIRFYQRMGLSEVGRFLEPSHGYESVDMIGSLRP